MVLAFVAHMGIFLLAAAFVVGPVRAFAIDRFGHDGARDVWVPAFWAMVLVGLLLPLGYGVADGLEQALARGTFQAVFTLTFFTFYFGMGVLPAGIAWARAQRDKRVAGLAAGVGAFAYLALIYPLVNVLNSCFLGHGILLPAGCN